MNELPDDAGDAELLDRYLAQLQAGGRPDREAFLRDHPELASALRCLEVLEGMAPLPIGEDASGSEVTAAWQPADGELPRDFGAYELLGRDRPRAAWAWSTRRGRRTSTGRWR